MILCGTPESTISETVLAAITSVCANESVKCCVETDVEMIGIGADADKIIEIDDEAKNNEKEKKNIDLSCIYYGNGRECLFLLSKDKFILQSLRSRRMQHFGSVHFDAGDLGRTFTR